MTKPFITMDDKGPPRGTTGITKQRSIQTKAVFVGASNIARTTPEELKMFGPGRLWGVDRLDPGLTKTNKNKPWMGVPGSPFPIWGFEKSLIGSRES